jgi:ABC-type transporter Mla subunit MlaD
MSTSAFETQGDDVGNTTGGADLNIDYVTDPHLRARITPVLDSVRRNSPELVDNLDQLLAHARQRSARLRQQERELAEMAKALKDAEAVVENVAHLSERYRQRRPTS